MLAADAAGREEPVERVRALVEAGWDGGRYLRDGDSAEFLPQGLGALVLAEELDRADELVEATHAHATATGSALHYLIATGHEAFIQPRRGDLTAAAGGLRDCVERAAEHELTFPVALVLSYCIDVLLERPDVADLAAMVETFGLGELAGNVAGAMVVEARGRLRAVMGRPAEAIGDLRQVSEVSEALGFTHPVMCGSWRSTLAVMLASSEHAEALALANAELELARTVGRPRRTGVALTALGIVAEGHDARTSTLDEAVTVLSGSPARLELGRALVELGAARRRHGQRTAAREALRLGLDHATRCGAVRLAERARIELAATGARTRRA